MNLNPIIQLTRKLSLNSQKIVNEVLLAYEKPNVYIKEHKERLKERDITITTEDLPWIALADALIQDEFALEIDWKEENKEIISTIGILLDRKGFLSVDLSKIEGDGLPTEKFLDLVSMELKKYSISLGYIDINSDSYVLFVSLESEIQELKELAGRAGFGISSKFS